MNPYQVTRIKSDGVAQSIRVPTLEIAFRAFEIAQREGAIYVQIYDDNSDRQIAVGPGPSVESPLGAD